MSILSMESPMKNEHVNKISPGIPFILMGISDSDGSETITRTHNMSPVIRENAGSRILPSPTPPPFHSEQQQMNSGTTKYIHYHPLERPPYASQLTSISQRNLDANTSIMPIKHSKIKTSNDNGKSPKACKKNNLAFTISSPSQPESPSVHNSPPTSPLVNSSKSTILHYQQQQQEKQNTHIDPSLQHHQQSKSPKSLTVRYISNCEDLLTDTNTSTNNNNRSSNRKNEGLNRANPLQSNSKFLNNTSNSTSENQNQAQPKVNNNASNNESNKNIKVQTHERLALEGILSKMREKEDQISILYQEVYNLKESLCKNRAETGASKHLYQNLRSDLGKVEKHLFAIEEKIEQTQEISSQNCLFAGDGCRPSSRGAVSSSSSNQSHSSCYSDIAFDYDRLIEGVKILNLRAETSSHSLGVCFNSGGATFKRSDGISLTIFKNGLLLGTNRDDFMAFTENRTKFFAQDIFDGYFPNEFQRQFPQGVLFLVQDKRTVVFSGHPKYSGDGYTLYNNNSNDIKSESLEDLPRLVPGKHLSSLKQRQFSYPKSSPTFGYDDNCCCSRSVTSECGSSSSTHSITSITSCTDLPDLTASYGVLLSKRSAQITDKVIKVKLKNIKTGACYKLKTSVFATVEEMMNHLMYALGQEEAKTIELIHSSPIGVLACTKVPLSDYGINSNTLLYFRLVEF